MDIGKFVEQQERQRTAAFRKSSAVKQKRDEEPGRWGLNDPDKYYEMYGLPKKLEDKTLVGAFMNGAATHGNALLSRSSLELLPGMYSFDYEVLSFLRDLSNDANKRFEVDLDAEGFTKTGIHTTFDSLRCPAGYFQTPMSYTTVDNAEYRKELGLSSGYTPRQRAIAEEVWRLILSEAKPSAVNVAKLSTGGMRRFSSSVQWKLDFANFITQPIEFERMLDAVDKDDVFTLANKYETIYATYIQKRGQVDRPDKIRYVFDLEYALSGGTKGKPFPTDKKVVIDGREWDDFSAIRARVVHAGPWTINCFLQVLATGHMQAMFKRFPKTFHINTRDEIKSVVDGNYIFCSDVTEYDRSMSRDAIEVAHDMMREVWDERMVKASWRLFTAPYYARPLGLESGKGQWVRNPMDWEEELFAGNRSGHALTSLMAKVNKVIESLIVIDKLYPVLGRAARFLKHEMPLALVNNGDDEIIIARQNVDMIRFKQYRADLSVGHYVVSPEEGNGYSGLLLAKTDVPLVYNPIPRVHTALQKMFIPERGIGGGHRKFWPIGMMVRVENLNNSDVGREVWALTQHHYRKHLEPKYGDIRAIIANGISNMSMRVDGLTERDREVLDDPDKLHYKWLPEEISKGVLDMVTSKIPMERTETILSRYYSGNLV
nr:P2 [Red mite associated cystovirus]